MSRSNQNSTPPVNWRSRPDYGPYSPPENRRSRPDYSPYSATRDSASRMASMFPLNVPAGAPLRDSGEVDHYPWWLLRESPVVMGSFPVPYFQYQNEFPDNRATRTTMARYPDASPTFHGQWNVQAPEEESLLTQDEQKRALNKLKKEIYNPTPKWLKRRPSLYYRDNPIYSSRETENDKDDDGKRCAVCLEDFEAKQVVTVTPCNHMFHEECIVPWVKCQGRCPVCRFAICEKFRENAAPSRNTVGNDQFENELMTIIRAMEQAFVSENMRRMI